MSMPRDASTRLSWVEPAKGLALLWIVLTHLTEQFGRGPWFTAPSADWPDLATRLRLLLPSRNPAVAVVQGVAWLGDLAPGVFIVLSGLGLSWAAQRAPLDTRSFFLRRVGRLFPLYIAAHLVLLGLSLAVPGSDLSLAHPATLFSLLGLRLHPDLFYYINPSWWYVWLTLQLYLLFPALAALLRRAGPLRFLAVCLGLTVLARLFGLLFLTTSLYRYMVGLFCGPRLFEFAFGMVLALCLFPAEAPHPQVLAWRRAFQHPVRWAAVLFPLGLLCSLTRPGSLVSAPLCSIGMLGLIYGALQAARRAPRLWALLTFLGVESYGIYLLHQTPLLWTEDLLGAAPRRHLIAALAVLLLSVPGAWLLSRGTDAALAALRGPSARRHLGWGGPVLALVLAASLVAVEPRLWTAGRQRAYALGLGLGLLLLGFAWGALPDRRAGWRRFTLAGVLCAGAIQLFFLPPRLGPVALGLGLLWAALAAGLAGLPGLGRRRAAVGAAALLLTLLCGAEVLLRRLHPLEAGRWGEWPALMVHPRRGYALRPGQTTRLRYNDYDYVLRTNALGLPKGLSEPEVQARRQDTPRLLVLGDAFTMPEGVAYERSYPALLAGELSTCGRRVEVVNAGVTGYGPNEVAAQLAELAPLLRPDRVLYQFFVNEFGEVAQEARERQEEIGLLPAGPLPHRLVLHAQLLAHGERLARSAEERRTGRPGTWRSAMALLPYHRTGESVYYAPERLQRLSRRLAEIKAAAAAVGAQVEVLFVPAAISVMRPEDLDYFPRGEDLHDRGRYDLERPLRALRALAAPLDLKVHDLTPALRAAAAPAYFRTSLHFTEAGHRAAARAIADILRADAQGGFSCPSGSNR
jgi:peptidoglycan/LPS O-acetylase OafA/YrhL